MKKWLLAAKLIKMNKVYKKFNSFLDLKVKNGVDQKKFLDHLKKILDMVINT